MNPKIQTIHTQIGAAHLDVSEYPEAASFQGLKAVELLAACPIKPLLNWHV